MSDSDDEVTLKKPRIEHRYTEPWDDSDVTLVVGDEKFHVHATILGLASPVFKTMFTSNFKEGKKKIVNLPGKDKWIIKDMLNLLYPIYFVITDYSTCRKLLELGREYDMEKIKLYVDDFLNEKVESSFEVLQLAEEFKLKKSREKLVKYYIQAWNADGVEIFMKGNWSSISDDTKIRIARNKIKELGCTDSFHAHHKTYKHCNHKLSIMGSKIQTLNEMMDAMYPDECQIVEAS